MKFKELRNKTKACEDNEVSNRSAALKPQMYNDPVTGKKKVRMVPTKSNIVKINDREDVKEAHDPKHVKMAIGVASDKRYKQGNYSGAVRAIEKIKKGLSKHPQVAAVLKRMNEEQVDEVIGAVKHIAQNVKNRFGPKKSPSSSSSLNDRIKQKNQARKTAMDRIAQRRKEAEKRVRQGYKASQQK
jgi:hypothetical protein